MTQQKADPLRRKALACLREGRVSVIYSVPRGSGRVGSAAINGPQQVVATVLSSRDRHPYRVDNGLDGTAWRCDCREGRRDLPCAHTLAVALVTTGVPS